MLLAGVEGATVAVSLAGWSKEKGKVWVIRQEWAPQSEA
jgi:hypothetical protein